jgi:ABC-type lipoprotein release transport system permease subunit
VLLQNRDQAASVMAALQSSPFQIEDWQQMNGILAQTEQMSQAYMVVLYLIVLAITASVIVNTLVMSVFERTREIASWPPLA